MKIDFESVLASEPFRCLVGLEQSLFYVHSELLSQHSEILARVVHGSFREAQEKCAILPEIEPDVFRRAVEYMYTSDYTVPEPDILLPVDNMDLGKQEEVAAGPSEPVEPIDQVDEERNELELFQTSTPEHESPAQQQHARTAARRRLRLFQHRVQGSRGRLWTEFTEVSYPKQKESWEPRSNRGSWEDYTPVFLCHAKIYVFGDYYMMKPLRNLALHRLRLTLAKFKLFKKRVADIVALVRYVYDGNTYEPTNGRDKLRSLVIQYLICHFELFMENTDFKKLLADKGSLGKDVAEGLLRRLS